MKIIFILNLLFVKIVLCKRVIRLSKFLKIKFNIVTNINVNRLL